VVALGRVTGQPGASSWLLRNYPSLLVIALSISRALRPALLGRASSAKDVELLVLHGHG